MDIKNMPHVTVEQVSKFRDAALQALNKKDAEIAELKAELSKHQSSEFHPDWSMLEACRENNQEISALYKELKGAVVLHLTYRENGCGYLSHLVLDALCLSRLGRYAV